MSMDPLSYTHPTTDAEEALLVRALEAGSPSHTVSESETHHVAPEQPHHNIEEMGPAVQRQAVPE